MKNKAGFTLIEILIALVILSIALTVMIKSTAQTIKNINYIQNKTIALWVGSEIINEIRAGLLNPPLEPDNLKNETEMLNQTWPWEAQLESTPNQHIKKINVNVYLNSTHARLIHLESYIYVAS